MKPQKKAAVAKKATKMPTVAKKRRTPSERTMSDARKEKKSKKNDKLEDSKRKINNEKKKTEKRLDDKRKMEEKKKERAEKLDEKKKQLRDSEKKSDKIDERKTDDKLMNEETGHESVDKKKLQKCEEKMKLEKQSVDSKKKAEKADEKKKNIKLDETSAEDHSKSLNTTEDKDALEDKADTLSPLPAKKRGNKDDKKKDVKPVKSDVKSISKNSTAKDKKSDRKKVPEKDSASSNKVTTAKAKKDPKTKQNQKKSGIARKTVLTKKPNLSVVKKLVDKKIKLVETVKDEEVSENEENTSKKTKKKSAGNIAKGKVPQEKKPKLTKHMKAKLPPKHSKISTALKKEDKLKSITEKIMARRKIELKESEEGASTEHKKIASKDEICQGPEMGSIKSEIEEDKDPDKSKEEAPCVTKLQDNKKAIKSGGKVGGKPPKKAGKATKVQTESNNQTSVAPEDASSEEFNKQSKLSNEDNAKSVVNSKLEQIGTENTIELDLKVEAMNGGESVSGVTSQSDSDGDSDDDYKKNKQRGDTKGKDRANSPSDERARRMRLFGFWSGPKRHRVASLNALAKVHCLYENETGGVYLGGYCKPKPEKEKDKDKDKPKKMKEEKEDQQQQQPPPTGRKEKEKKVECKTEENVLKRKLRNVPGLRGKHWDMIESSSSSSSSDEDYEKEKSAEPSKKKMTKRRRRNEEVMDLKDMVVCKRMASLNATAILAASYSDEKNRCGSSSDSSSSESEVEIIKRRRQNDSDIDKKKSRQGSDPDDVIKPSKKVVIVNQDTDVTITGN